MIQTALFFILGFLSAVFLALLVAPAIWRRAVVLTRQRVENSLPLTMTEIQADKDRLRSEHAVATRQLEMTIKSQRDKIAAFMIAEGNTREEALAQAAQLAEKVSVLEKYEEQVQELRDKIEAGAARESDLSAEIAALQDKAGAQSAHVEKLGRMYDEASIAASTRQIEMVAQETKLAKLSDDVALLRADLKAAHQRKREAEVEAKSLNVALKDEHKKVVGLENKLARMTSTLTDAEEQGERRDKELTRLREQLKGKAGASASSADLDRLEARASKLVVENRRLRSALESGQGQGAGSTDRESRDTTMLREQIGALAAEVVHLTASLEGPDSPIYGVIDADKQDLANKVSQRSLADRIRALRAAETARRD